MEMGWGGNEQLGCFFSSEFYIDTMDTYYTLKSVIDVKQDP